jgi:NAD(P)-dependent dehydrogenase (short-subunit alcohol dehydrogenase family)
VYPGSSRRPASALPAQEEQSRVSRPYHVDHRCQQRRRQAGRQGTRCGRAHGVGRVQGLAAGEAAASEVGNGTSAIQIDVTDAASIAAAASRTRDEFGRLDLLVNNAGISHSDGQNFTMETYAAMSKASLAPLDEVRAVWEVNVFGTLAVYQAMLPLLRESSYARIVNVTSGLGSLAAAADPANQSGQRTAPSTPPPRPRSTL